MRPYDERLDHFLSRAAKVFADQGYHSTTMRDLAAATDMSLAGMYYYVRGKEELLFRIQERCLMRVTAGAVGALAGQAGAAPGARALRTREHPHEAALLDTEEQLLLAADVVIHASERHVGRRGGIAHRSRVIALVGEDLRRPGQEVVEPLVVGAHGGFERLFEIV